jgi:hypothetical protein
MELPPVTDGTRAEGARAVERFAEQQAFGLIPRM